MSLLALIFVTFWQDVEKCLSVQLAHFGIVESVFEVAPKKIPAVGSGGFKGDGPLTFSVVAFV